MEIYDRTDTHNKLGASPTEVHVHPLPASTPIIDIQESKVEQIRSIERRIEPSENIGDPPTFKFTLTKSDRK